jgi:hypothetical protein
MAQIIPIRGTRPAHHKGYPDFPRYVPPRQHTGAELSRMVGDPDAAFARDEEGDHVWTELQRFNREHPVDLNAWLNRGRKQRLQRIVTVAALVVAWFAILYFAFQMGRGL